MNKPSTLSLTGFIIGNTLGYCLIYMPSVLATFSRSTFTFLLIPLSCLLILPTALSYSKLNQIYPKAHGDTSYLSEGYNKYVSHAFSLISAGVILPLFITVTINLISDSLSQNLTNISSLLSGKSLKLLFIISFFLLNILSLNFSLRVQTCLTVCRCAMIGIFFIISVFVNFNVVKIISPPGISTKGPSKFEIKSLVKAIIVCAGSFDGFNSLNFIAYTMPKTSFRKPIVFALLIETLFFICIFYSFNTVLNQFNEPQTIVFDYFNNLEINQTIKKIFPPIFMVLSFSGIINGCVIILKSILLAYFRKADLIMMVQGGVTFCFTFFDALAILMRLAFLTNTWYFITSSVLLFGRRKKKLEDNSEKNTEKLENTENKENKEKVAEIADAKITIYDKIIAILALISTSTIQIASFFV